MRFSRPIALTVALALVAPALVSAATIGWYGSDANCNDANIDETPHIVWGNACWGGSFWYGLGTIWENGASRGNTIELSLPHLGNISVGDAFAITDCSPGSVTVGTWPTGSPKHPNYCSGPPLNKVKLQLGVCTYDPIAKAYHKLLDDACALPPGSSFFWMDMHYDSTGSCNPSTLIYSSSYWSGSAASYLGYQCQYAEVPAYYGSYQYWQGSGRDRASVTVSTFRGGQYQIKWFQEEDPYCTGVPYTSVPWSVLLDGSCLQQSRDAAYSLRARTPPLFATSNMWPTPTPSKSPSPSPDLSAYSGRLGGGGGSSAAEAAPDGSIVGGVVGALALVSAAAGVFFYTRGQKLEAKRLALEHQAGTNVPTSAANPVNPVVMQQLQKQQQQQKQSRGRR